MEHSKVIQELKEASKEMKPWQFALMWLWLVLSSPMPFLAVVIVMLWKVA